MRRFPDSIFASRVRREMLLSATLLKDWPTVVALGDPLFREPLWHGQREVVGIYLAEGLWHTGFKFEAEALLNSIGRSETSYILHKLRSGEG